MPEAPPGEKRLRSLAERHSEAEARIRDLVAEAIDGDRREAAVAVAAVLTALRRLDARDPVRTAYLAAFRRVRRGGAVSTGAVGPAVSLASKLDRGAQTVQRNAREAIRSVTADTLDELADDAVTAHVDRIGGRWMLGAYAAMTTATIGRQATTRGLVDGVGPKGKLMVETGGCDYCSSFEGEAMVGDPVPPFHPSCTCVASAA